MKRILSVAIGATVSVLALGVMAAVAGPIVYRTMSATPTAITPTAMPTIRESGQGQPRFPLADYTGTWALNNESTAGYTVSAVLNGSEVSITGVTDHITGSASVSGRTLMMADVTVEVATITTDNANRDAYFRNQVLETGLYPTATFVLTSPVDIAKDLAAGQPKSLSATGNLTLHGITRAVTVNLVATLGSSSLTIQGSVPISFEDYDVTAPSLGFVRVDDHGAITFSLDVSPR